MIVYPCGPQKELVEAGIFWYYTDKMIYYY